MDIKRETNNRPAWAKPKNVGITLVACLFLGLYFYGQQFSNADLQVNGDHLLFSQVQQGPMAVSVSGNGVLAPDNITWLASRVTGRVERVFVKAGARVTKGDVIVQLSNPELMQATEELRWEQETLEAELAALQVALAANALKQKADTLQAQFAYESAHLQLEAETQLINRKSGVVSQIDYKRTQLKVEQLKRSWGIQQQLQEKSSHNVAAQIKAKTAQTRKSMKALQRAEERVVALRVTAPTEGVVQETELKQGQQISAGGLLAKIVDPTSLYAEVQLSEQLIAEVELGQQATIDIRREQFQGEVTRIDPNVVNGRVQVDIKLNGVLPENARPDLSVTAKVDVTNLSNTLFIERPAFVRSNDGNKLYRLDEQGFAHKVNVQLGKASASKIQILSGLDVGDTIVLSDTSNWQQFNTVLIN